MQSPSLLRPLVAARSFRLWRTVVHDDWSEGPVPPGRAFVRAPGVRPLQLLILGGGPAAGYGVTTHELSLAGHVARQTASVTGRGVDLEVIVDRDTTVGRARELADEADPARFDAVILSVGVQDALDGADPFEWAEEMAALIGLFVEADGPHPQVFLIAVPPISRVLTLASSATQLMDDRAAELNERLRDLASRIPSTHFLDFLPTVESDGARHRSSETYRGWAKQLAPQLACVIGNLVTDPGRALPVDGIHDAVQALGILDTPRDGRFDHIVAAAQVQFHAAASAIGFLDDDREWFKAVSGTDLEFLPRGDTFCSWTIQHAAPFVVTDARHDVRFSSYELVRSANIRAYAGHPILDAAGIPVGAICVVFTRPRQFSDEDLAFLRQLAGLVEMLLNRP